MHRESVIGFDTTSYLARQTCPIEQITISGIFIIEEWKEVRIARSEIVDSIKILELESIKILELESIKILERSRGGVLYYWSAKTESFLITYPDTINVGDSVCYNVFLLNSLINGKARPIDFGNVILLNPIFVRQRSTGWN